MKNIKLGAVMFSMMLEELYSGPCTVQALVDHTGMHSDTVCNTLRAMHARKVVHIAAWERDSAGRFQTRVWAIGPGTDARKPKKRRAEINRDYVERKRLRALVQLPAGASIY